MHIIFGFIIIIAIILGPQWWVRKMLRKYSNTRTDIPGTGGQLVKHLASRFQLPELSVEITTAGDHYDPRDKTIRLSEDHFNDHSLTAITIAAHEFGHALQDAQGYPPFKLRGKLVQLSQHAQKIGGFALLAAPLAGSFGPAGFGLMIGIVIFTVLLSTLVHIVTLPVELDASFNRALPLLVSGKYISPDDTQAAQQILRAAAFTYVSSSLASLLNLWRWLPILRR